MIVTIRGTSGSGKSTLARRIMDHYQDRVPHHIEGRKQPLMYRLTHPVDGRPALRVLGHYESPTGGGDTISSGLDYIDQLAREGHAEGDDVLYEGLVISSDFRRIAALHADGIPTLVVVLNTPLRVCLDSVADRRRARAEAKGTEFVPLNPKTTTSKHRAVELMVPRFRAAGVPVGYADRETAYESLVVALRLQP